MSGCVSSGKTKTEIVSEDMLLIKSIEVFPSKELQPDNTLIIRMEVENSGQESAYLLVDKNSTDSKSLTWNGDYLLIDHCSSLYNANTKTSFKDADFQILSGGSCATVCDAADTNCDNPLIPLVKDSEGKEIGALRDSSGNVITSGGKPMTACYLRVPSGQSHTFQWSLKAPSASKIADIAQKCTFKFQVAYAAKAITNTYVYFADPIEVAQRMYTKKDMTLVGDNIASYGPVAVNFAPAEPQPIPARSGGTWTVFLNLKNVGNGIATVNDMNLALPEGTTTANCIVLEGVADKLNAVNIIYAARKEYDGSTTIPEGVTVWGQLQWYTASYCSSKTTGACSPENKEIVQKQYDFCQPLIENSFCEATFPAIKTDLEDTLNKLKIYSGTSSSIPCELTIPEGVTILTPFRFVTAADYSYSIRQDIPITTKPVKELA